MRRKIGKIYSEYIYKYIYLVYPSAPGDSNPEHRARWTMILHTIEVLEGFEAPFR